MSVCGSGQNGLCKPGPCCHQAFPPAFCFPPLLFAFFLQFRLAAIAFPCLYVPSQQLPLYLARLLTAGAAADSSPWLRFCCCKGADRDWEGVNCPLNKCIPLNPFSSPVSRLSCPEKHFPGVLSLLTPQAPELLPKLNAFYFHASAKSLLLPAQPISSQATQKQLQQQKASVVINILPCNASAGWALQREMVRKSPCRLSGHPLLLGHPAPAAGDGIWVHRAVGSTESHPTCFPG